MANPVRITLVLALILGGLGAYVYFVDLPQSQEALQQTQEERRLIPFDDRAISHLTMKTREEEIILMRDDKNRWHITQPIIAPADSREVRKILRALTIGKIQRVIQQEGEDKDQDDDQYGLTPPHMILTITAGGTSEMIDLGNRAPLSSTLYARKHSDNIIILTTLNPLTFANKSLHTFRKKEILSFDTAQAEKFQIDRGDETLILIRQPGAHGLSPNWSFRSPMKGPADRTTVGLLLRDLEGLQAQGFVDSQSEKEELFKKLGAPTVRATVHARNRDHTVSFFQSPDVQDTYAMTKNENPLYRIAPDIVAGLTKDIFKLRDKRLLGMEKQELAILAVKTPAESYTLVHQSGEWVIEDDISQILNQDVVRLFVSRVVDLPAEFRVAKEETTLGRYGLDSPTVEIRATDMRGQERGRLLLGKSRKGLVYATGAGLPGVHQARSLILTQIPSRHQILADSSSR
ncbi:MAG: DUF4340 domain-containing protein [Nitrospirota bacterium]|nr:MAG: DUF4340 domain-containing protein [Nitrospirota bacterium]